MSDYYYNERRYDYDEYRREEERYREPAPPEGADFQPLRSENGAGPAQNGGGGAPPSGEDTSLLKNKLSDVMRMWKASSKQDLWKVIIVKATARDANPPKPKHVATLVDGVNYGGPNSEIIHQFEKRLREKDWLVVTKALSCLHHIMRQTTNRDFVKYICGDKKDMFDMSAFVDVNPSAAANMRIVKTYGVYLQAACALKLDVDYPPSPGEDKSEQTAAAADKWPLRFRNAKIEEVLDVFPVLIAALGEFPQIELGSSPATKLAIVHVGRDLGLIYDACVECADTIYDSFFRLNPRKEAREAITLYKKFEVDARKMLEQAKPKLQVLPQYEKVFSAKDDPYERIERMEDYLRYGANPNLGTGLSRGPRSEFARYEQRGGYGDYSRPPPPAAGVGGAQANSFFIMNDFSEGAAAPAKGISFDPFAEEKPQQTNPLEEAETPAQARERLDREKAERKLEKERRKEAERRQREDSKPFASSSRAGTSSDYQYFNEPAFDPFASQPQQGSAGAGPVSSVGQARPAQPYGAYDTASSNALAVRQERAPPQTASYQALFQQQNQLQQQQQLLQRQMMMAGQQLPYAQQQQQQQQMQYLQQQQMMLQNQMQQLQLGAQPQQFSHAAYNTNYQQQYQFR